MEPTSNFEYLQEAAKKYGTLYTVDELESFVDNINEQELKELERVHNAIDAREDSFNISRWMDDCFKRRAQISTKEFDFSTQVGQMFRLFDYLGRRGIQPFSSESVEYIEEAKKPSWQNLPRDLEYLVEPAMKYGIHQSGDDRYELLQRATHEDFAELAAVAERVRVNDHHDLVEDFLDKYPITDNPEAANLHFLFGLMAEAGLQFLSENWNTVEQHVKNLARFGSFRLASERMHAAKALVDFGEEAKAAIPALQRALNDEDLRVCVWAHYALAAIEGRRAEHEQALREIFSQHDKQDELECYDDVGEEANAALEKLCGL